LREYYEQSDEDIQVTFYLTDAHEMNWVTEFIDAPFFARTETEKLFRLINWGNDVRAQKRGTFSGRFSSLAAAACQDSRVRLYAHSRPAGANKTFEAQNRMRRSLARPCARICARTRRILLTIRDRDDFIRKTCFPFVKRIRFEMKSDALKSMISQS